MIPARRWLPLAIAVTLAGGTVLVRLQDGLDRDLGDYRVEEQILYLSSGEWVKRVSLGYNGLMACLYWTRAVQHYGRETLGQREYKLLYELLDITTTLDPELLLAYRFGAIFLSEKPPSGPDRPELAIRLLEKGIENNPDHWRFYYDLGFVYYRGMKDYGRAAEAFRKGAQHPEAPPWMAVMAAKIADEGGDRATARFLWRELYNSTDDPLIRENALRHLYELRVEEDVEFLEAQLTRFETRTGRPAASWQDLVESGLLRGIPVDPFGFPYELHGESRVGLHPQSPLVTRRRAQLP